MTTDGRRVIEALKVIRDTMPEPQLSGIIATPKDLDALQEFIGSSKSPTDCTIVAMGAYNLAIGNMRQAITDVIADLEKLQELTCGQCD